MGFFDDLSEQVGILTDRAEEFLDDVLVPDDVRRLLERASQLIARDNYEQASELLERARGQSSDVYRVHYLLGLCHFFRQRYRDADKAFGRALDLREEAEAHYYAGLTAEQRSEWSRARRHFSRALGLEDALPFEAEVYFGLGRVSLALDRPERAVRALRRALDAADDDSTVDADAVRIFLTEAEFDAGETDTAYETSQSVEPPSNADVLTLFARVAAATGRHEQAGELLQTALDNAPGYAPALLEAGRLDRQRGDLRSAEQHLLDAVNAGSSETLVAVYRELGSLYDIRGESEQARRAFEAALDESPDSADLHLRTGRICLRDDDLPAAADHFQRTLTLTESQPQSWTHRLAERGLALESLRAGTLSETRRRLDILASREDPPHPETLCLRAELHLADDDPGQALGAAHTALRRLARDTPGEDVDAANLQQLFSPDELRDRLTTVRRQATDRLAHDWHLPDALEDSVDVEQTLETLRSFLTDDARLETFFSRWRAISNRMERPLSVALVGEFNVGKSTLANALLGEAVVPTGILPTTAHTCRIGYGARRACRVVYRGNASDAPGEPNRAGSGIDHLRSVWRYSDVDEVDFEEAARRMNEESDQIHHLEYLYPHPRLRSMELIDTPGFNADDAHSDVARGVIDDAEAIVWVLDAGQALSMTEFDVIDDIRQPRERLVVVVNKLDELGTSPDERRQHADELVTYLEERIGDRIAGLFPMSAERVLQAATASEDIADDLQQRERDAFAAFTDRLEGDIVERSGRLKTLEARRELAVLADDLLDFREDHLATYQSCVDTLDDIGERLADRATQLTESLPAEMAGRVADQLDFAAEAAANDIEEMMRPADNWMSQALGARDLEDSDRSFITEVFADRICDILQRARQETGRRADVLQDEALDALDSALQPLATDEHRFVRRRLEAMVDESRAHRILLEERVFGHIRADMIARLETAGPDVFETLADAQTPREAWPDRLRSVLPDIEQRLESALTTWCDTFGRLLTRTARRLADDITLLRLEARARWTLDPLIELTESVVDRADD